VTVKVLTGRIYYAQILNGLIELEFEIYEGKKIFSHLYTINKEDKKLTPSPHQSPQKLLSLNKFSRIIECTDLNTN
jgi:hypothetical protein